MKRRHFLLYSGAAALCAKLPIAWAQSSAEMPTIYGPTAMPSLLLGVAGERQRRGESLVEVPFQVKTWQTPDMLRAGFANGSIEASFVPSYVGVNLANRGLDIKLINVMSWGLLNIIGPTGEVKQLQDFEGRTMVVPLRQDMPDLVLQTLCKLQGVDFNAIDVKYTATPPEAMSLWLNERAEFSLLNEPIVSLGLQRTKHQGMGRVLNLRNIWREAHNMTSQGMPQVGLVVTKAFYEKHHDFLKDFQEELKACLDWSLSHQQEAALIGEKFLDLPASAILTSLPHSNLAVASAGENKDDINLFYRALYELNPKILGGSLPQDDFFVTL